jgi:ketosteroid isomerase-like protein
MAQSRGRASQAREAVEAHVRLWNAGEKALWLELFAEDVVYEDPPGVVVSQGRDVMSEYAWDRSFTPTKRWLLEPTLVIACGHEAVVHMRNHGAVSGRPAWVDSLEVYAVDAAGLITSLRAFWEPPNDPAIQSELSINQWEQPAT